MTHDYKRNGTTTLFAALETLEGKVVGECHERHRHQEFLSSCVGSTPSFRAMSHYISSWTTTGRTSTRSKRRG